jgi:transposase
MKLFLHSREKRKLQLVVKYPEDAAQLKRAQGLLALSEGEPWKDVAHRLQVGRNTLYDWIERYQSRTDEPIGKRLLDRPRAGRPATRRKAVERELAKLLERKPTEYGYRYAEWTAELLQAHLEQAVGLQVGENTVRRALHGLGYRWKRPRFVLRRRSATWRQAKGGFYPD